MRNGLFLLITLVTTSCASPSAADQPGPRAVTITPDRPAIGDAFSVKLVNLASREMAAGLMPDGTYTIAVSPIGEGPSFWESLFPSPPKAPSLNEQPPRVTIGTVIVNGGVGESRFILQSDYGSGILAVPGKPLGLYVQGELYSSGGSLVVGGQ